jgi:hypothetical protein
LANQTANTIAKAFVEILLAPLELFYISSNCEMIFYSDSPKLMDVDKIKKEDKGIKKEKEESKEG